MSSDAEKKDPRVLWSGDIIGIMMGSAGIMSFPSFEEPIPEKEEVVSHLRVCKEKSFRTADFRRCMFRVENDIGLRSEVLFGSIVTLTHYPSGLLLTGSEHVDTGYIRSQAVVTTNGLVDEDEPLNCVYLLSQDNLDAEETAHRWIISPRYNLREEGEPVRNSDYIYLRNVKYQSKFIASFPVSGSNPLQRHKFEDFVGCASATYVQARPGLQVNILRKCPRALEDESGGGGGSKKGKGKAKKKGKKKKKSEKKTLKNKTEEELEEERVERTTVFSGDFVRIYHREHRGHIICRVNDEDAFHSVVTPLGLVNRRRGMRPDFTHGIYSRKLSAQQPRTTMDFPITYSSLGVWQILPGDQDEAADSNGPNSFSTIMFTKPVRLRHLVSGQFLAIRPSRKGDLSDLKKFTSLKVHEVEEAARKGRTADEDGDDISDNDSAAQQSLASGSAVDHKQDQQSKATETDSDNFMLKMTSVIAFDLRISELTTSEFDVYLNMSCLAAAPVTPDNAVAAAAATATKLSEGAGKSQEAEPWNYRTDPISYGGHQITWRFEVQDDATLLDVIPVRAESEPMIVRVMRKNSAGKEVVLATGEVLLPSDPDELMPDQEIECAIDLMDTTSFKKFVGSLKVYMTMKTKENKAALENYLLGEYTDHDEMDREILDTADRDDDEQFQHYRNYEWTVGTCSDVNVYSEFNLVEVDTNELEFIVNYGEMFSFEHRLTKQRLKLADIVGLADCNPEWWEYRSDMALAPVYTKPTAIRDAEVCQFERVDVSEVVDILYCSRFASVSRGCTVSLQLTARAEHLYRPMFRHFQKSLQTLVLWTLGETESDSTLCSQDLGADESVVVEEEPQNNSAPLAAPVLPGSSRKGSFGIFSESAINLRKVIFSSHSNADMEAEDSDQHRNSVHEVASAIKTKFPELQPEDADSDGSSLAGGETRQPFGVVKQSSYDMDDQSSVSSDAPQHLLNNNFSASMDESTSEVGDFTESSVGISSLAPWIGRLIPRGTALLDEESKHRPLRRYSNRALKEMTMRNVPMNATLYRRQTILAESMIVEQIIHFVNVLFLLQRAILNTQDDKILKKYPAVPDFILECSAEIHQLLRASIYKNERVALKIISVNGSFLSLMSQMIIGWDPPIQSILELTCGNQNYSSGGKAVTAVENSKAGEKTPNVKKEHTAEQVLINAISETDIYQIVQQMLDLHIHEDPTATKILTLLTMLCRSGGARHHFQNLLVGAVAHQDHTPIVQGTAMTASTRASSLQTNSLLFHTRCVEGKWQVSFGNKYSFPSHGARDPAAYVKQSVMEASSLVNLFMLYNDNQDEDDMTLDMGECFNMLQDLGFGGPFLHRETHILAESSVWSMLKWWCYRYSFYYPSSSNSHCQLSPMHVMHAMGLPITEALLANEAVRISHQQSGSEYADLDFFMDVINTEVTGLYMNFIQEEEDDLDFAEDVDDLMNGMVLNSPDDSFTAAEEKIMEPKPASPHSFPSVAVAGPTPAAATGGVPVTPRGMLLKKQMTMRIAKSLSRGKEHRKKMSAHNRQNTEHCKSTAWHDVLDVFHHPGRTLSWFRQSLRLLAELCHDDNSHAQEIVTVVVPAEFIMTALQTKDQLALRDQSLLLKLLRNLYVSHDSVHPTRCLPVHQPSLRYNDGTVYCGHHEAVLNPSSSIGKVFNSLSRVKFYGDGALDGASLRTLLFYYVRRSMHNIRLQYRSNFEVEFVTELLRLYRALLNVGFFQEPEMGFLTERDSAPNAVADADGYTETTLDKFNSLIGIRTRGEAAHSPSFLEFANDENSHINAAEVVPSPVSKERRSSIEPKKTSSVLDLKDREAAKYGRNFTLDGVKKSLIRRLNENALIHQCTTDFNINFEEMQEGGSQRSSKRKQGASRKDSNPELNAGDKHVSSSVVSAWRAQYIAKRRRDFSKLKSAFLYFDSTHTDVQHIKLLQAAVDVLESTYNMKQYLRIQKSWNHIGDTSDRHSKIVATKHVSDLDEQFASMNFDTYFVDLYQAGRHLEPCPGYTVGVLRATLYDSFELRRSCYDLLDRQLCPVRDADNMLPPMQFIKNPADAFKHRLVAVYISNLLKNLDIVQQRPYVTESHHIERLIVAVEHIRALCFSDFMSTESVGNHNGSGARNASSGSSSSSPSSPQPRQSRSASFADKTISTRPDEEASTDKGRSRSGGTGPRFLEDAIPCVNPLDDELQLAQEEYLNSESRFNELCSEYQYRYQVIEDIMVDSHVKLDCLDMVRRLCMKLISKLEEITCSPHLIPWAAFYHSERLIIDEVFGLLASVGQNDNLKGLCQSWFSDVSPMLIEYFPESIGSANLITVFFKQCGYMIKEKPALASQSDAVPLISKGAARTHAVAFKSFTVTMLRKAVEQGLTQTNTYSRFISALLQNKGTSIVQLAVTFYTPYILKCSKRYDFRLKSIAKIRDDFSQRNVLHYIIRPFRLTLSNAAEDDNIKIPLAVIQLGKRLYTKEFLEHYLSSHEVSLMIKIDLMHIYFMLYPDYERGPVELLVLSDLKRMRVALSIECDGEADIAACSSYCFDYISNGVIPLLEKRLLQSAITGRDRINFMIGAVISAEARDAAPNKFVADQISDFLKEHVFNLTSGQHLADPQDTNALLSKSESRDHSAYEGVRAISVEQNLLKKSNDALETLDEMSETSLNTRTAEHYVPTAVVECFMMVLNVLQLNGSDLGSKLSEENKYQILWVATSILLLLRDFPTLVISPEDHRPINARVAAIIKKRVTGLVSSLIREIIVSKTKQMVGELFDTNTLKVARKQLNNIAITAPERFYYGAFDEEKEFEEFMQLGRVYPSFYLRASPLFKAFAESFKSAIHFLSLGGNLMFGDWRNATLNSKAFARKFGAFPNFDLWMRGGGRLVVCMFDYLRKVQDPSKLEFNLLHVLIGLMKHEVYDIQNDQRLSLATRQQQIERELKRFQIVQSAMADLGASTLVISVLGRAHDNNSNSFAWTYAPLTIAFGNQVVAFQNQEVQEEMIAEVQLKISQKKPPEMNMLLGFQGIIRNCGFQLSYSSSPSEKAEQHLKDDYSHPQYETEYSFDKQKSAAGKVDIVDESNRTSSSAVSSASTPAYSSWGLHFGHRHHQQRRRRFRQTSRDTDWDQTKILRVTRELFAFVGIFCKGDDLLSQNFFSAYQAESREYVDLIQELGSLANVSASKLVSMFEYIDDEDFYERIAPPVWESKDSSKRRFLAWDSPSNCLNLYTQYLHTFSTVFDNMVGIFNARTTNDLQQAMVKLPDILEFAGLMQLRTKSKLLTVGAVGQDAYRTLRWDGGDPFRFYRTYFHEMAHAHLLTDEEEVTRVQKLLELWYWEPDRMFGVSKKLFMRFIQLSEDKCLSTILSFLDYASVSMSNDFFLKLPENILLQNMDNIFQLIRKKSTFEREAYSAVVVKYLSLLESMAVPLPDVGEFVRLWGEMNSKRGRDPKTVFATVEIVGKSNKLQRIFFPIPSFVTVFWPYPVVQRTKDLIVMEVNRDSAEEKLADYYEWQKRLVSVMKRQELLRKMLTYPVHAMFGGKTTVVNRFFPSQRALAITITTVISVYFAYYSSLPAQFSPPSDSLAEPFKPPPNPRLEMLDEWTEFQWIFVGVRMFHILLHGSIALSSLLNGSALVDTFAYFYKPQSRWNAVTTVLVAPIAVWHAFIESLWPISMAGLAFIAGFVDMFTFPGYALYWAYTPMLIDIAFQVQFMSFLFNAVSLNAVKIMYTVLLACLCLYFYSVLATLYFHGQYDLDGHFGCQNVVACFKLHLDYGLYNVPNWAGDFYITPEIPGFSFVYGQTVFARLLGTIYNVTYVILINLVLQSIISGLIIDTFSSLREANETTLRDISDKCFICSIPKDDFEQNEVPFEEHVKEEHNMWHYLWFQIYLDSKDELSYSSAENYAAEEMSEKSSFVRLMPLKRSMTLEQKNQEEVEDFKIEERLDELAMLLTRIQRQQANALKSLEQLKKTTARIDTKR